MHDADAGSWFAIASHLRLSFNLAWAVFWPRFTKIFMMADRPNVGCWVFDCSGLSLWNGLSLPKCGHGGLAPKNVYHGTKCLDGIISDKGIMKVGSRFITRKVGFYHFEDLEKAFQYAVPRKFRGADWRIVLEINAACRNSTGRKRGWQYTQKRCYRYAIEKIVLCPADEIKDIRIL